MSTVIKLSCNMPCIYKYNDATIQSDIVVIDDSSFIISVLPLTSAIPIYARFSIKGGLECSHCNVNITKLVAFRYIATFTLESSSQKLAVLTDNLKLKTAEHSLHYTSYPHPQIQIECHEAYISLPLSSNESYSKCTVLSGETLVVDTGSKIWIIAFKDGDYDVLNVLEKSEYRIEEDKIYTINTPKTICKLKVESEYSPADNYRQSEAVVSKMGLKYNYTDKTVGVHLLECILYGAYSLIASLVDLSFSEGIEVTPAELKSSLQEVRGKAKKGERTKEEEERTADDLLRLLKSKKLYLRLKDFFGDYDEILYFEDKILLKSKADCNKTECREFSFTVINKIIVDIIEV